MESALIAPAKAWILGLPGFIWFLLIPVVGVALFTFIMARRIAPLVRGAADNRLDRPFTRMKRLLKIGIGQARHPRYPLAGVIHIVLFAGFMVISLHSITLVLQGLKAGYVLPGLSGTVGDVYRVAKDILGTLVLLAALAAIGRRAFLKPKRYEYPPRFGKPHTWEAYFVLLMITGLMVSDGIYEGSLAAAAMQKGMDPGHLIPLTINWVLALALNGVGAPVLQKLHVGSYFCHEIIFFTFLNFLPMGKHFHVILALPNVFLGKLDKGTVKPVRWDISEEEIDDLERIGVTAFDDFTWKHMMDFYACVDCGRCSDRCPANRVGRPLSPRFISIKNRDYCFKKYPLRGNMDKRREELIGSVLDADEIWSCTTCGACEEECPVTIEYIDKMVDLRRGMVEQGNVPQSLQKPLSALEKRGNPYGKMEKKRAEWIKPLKDEMKIPVLDKGGSTDTLYFVDSVTSFDDRIQEIGRSTARVLKAANVDFGILGPAERDSGHEVRRFGEEMLFFELRDTNTEAIKETGAKQIVTADPHALNALRHDYADVPPVRHVAQVLDEKIKAGELKLKPVENGDDVYVYHDPCYLGRHNLIYDEPRRVIDAIPGIRRVEMEGNCRDRSFCCGGGGLMLFYEPIEEERMGQVRVRMAAEAGATVIVTACPFCMVNIEDAIKTSGMEGKMRAIDLSELVDRHLVRAEVEEAEPAEETA